MKKYQTLTDEIQDAKNEIKQTYPTDLESPEYKKLIADIVLWRRGRAISQAELAAAVGVSQSMICKAERGAAYCPRLIAYYAMKGGGKNAE